MCSWGFLWYASGEFMWQLYSSPRFIPGMRCEEEYNCLWEHMEERSDGYACIRFWGHQDGEPSQTKGRKVCHLVFHVLHNARRCRTWVGSLWLHRGFEISWLCTGSRFWMTSGTSPPICF